MKMIHAGSLCICVIYCDVLGPPPPLKKQVELDVACFFKTNLLMCLAVLSASSDDFFLFAVPLQQGFSTCGPRTAEPILWGHFFRDADSQAASQPSPPRNSGGRTVIHILTSSPGDPDVSESLRNSFLETGQELQR